MQVLIDEKRLAIALALLILLTTITSQQNSITNFNLKKLKKNNFC